MQISHRLSLVAVAATVAACAPPSSPDPADVALESEAQKFGYAVGIDIGTSLKAVKDDVDTTALIAGIETALAGNEPRLGDEEREQIKAEVSQRLQEKQQEERVAKAEGAKSAGEKFLAENAQREGVQVTESGLQYEHLEEGEGASPTSSDKVQVHYRGTLLNGEEFDSSYKRGEPITFPLGNVIAGWTEGLQLMKVGGKAKLYIPSGLAYGERGAGAKIGPNETLVFEVELLDVMSGEAKPADK